MSAKLGLSQITSAVTLALTEGPLGGDALSKFACEIDAALRGATPDELSHEVQRAEIQSQLLRSQARVAIELALAARIHSATEVEIEEHYEAEGSGEVGADLTKQFVGAHGAGRKLTRRIVRLTGWPLEAPPAGAAKADPTTT